MANVKVVGRAVHITSGISVKDLERIMRYSPDSLELKDEEGNYVYGVCLSERPGINAAGVDYAKKTGNADGYAELTILSIPEGTTDAKKWVAENYGLFLSKLAAVEDQILADLTEINATIQAVENSIEVI